MQTLLGKLGEIRGLEQGDDLGPGLLAQLRGAATVKVDRHDKQV